MITIVNKFVCSNKTCSTINWECQIFCKKAMPALLHSPEQEKRLTALENVSQIMFPLYCKVGGVKKKKVRTFTISILSFGKFKKW